jgi:hypothetical protein
MRWVEQWKGHVFGGRAQQSDLQHHRSINEDWPPDQSSRAPLHNARKLSMVANRRWGKRQAFPHPGAMALPLYLVQETITVVPIGDYKTRRVPGP